MLSLTQTNTSTITNTVTKTPTITSTCTVTPSFTPTFSPIHTQSVKFKNTQEFVIESFKVHAQVDRADNGISNKNLEIGTEVILRMNLSGENLYGTIENNYLTMTTDISKVKKFVITVSTL